MNSMTTKRPSSKKRGHSHSQESKTPPLGQHFLTSQRALTAICSAGAILPTDTVLEIGPGKGVLTKELLARAGSVVAIERDSALIPHLTETFEDEIGQGRLVLVEGDALTYNPNTLGRYKLIANIPYYITGAIIRTYLTADNQPECMVLLVQKEIAERIARSEKESLLSLSVKVYGEPRYVETVKAGSFNPPPKVDSAILAIDNISRDHLKGIDDDFFFTVLRAGFSQRRKMLKGNLSSLFTPDHIDIAFHTTGIDPLVRAEDLGLNDWLALVRVLSK